MNLSKTTWSVLLFIVVFVVAGVCVYQWWQTKGELVKQIGQNENLVKQIDELQKEIEELKSNQAIEDKKSKVTIATDKTEYKQGQEAKISVDYDGNLYIRDPQSCWSIQKSIDDSWVELQKFSSNPCIRECKDVPTEKIIECAKCPLELPVWEFKRGNTITFRWDQRYLVSIETYQCYGYNKKVINEECLNYEQVSPGEYKIRLEYALKIKNYTEREGTDIKYAEKEFKIVK